MKDKLLIGAGVMVLVIVGVLLLMRRRAAAQAAGLTAATPSPQAALAAAGAPRPGVPLGQLPGVAAQSALNYLAGQLPPVIGAGLQASIPQTGATPQQHIESAAATLSQAAKIPFLSAWIAPVAKQAVAAASINYNAGAGYYG